MERARDEVSFRTEYASRNEHHVIGVMSGTSLDGIDAVLVRIRTRSDGALETVQLLAHSSLPYSAALRSRVAALCARETACIDELVYAHFGLAEWYARAVALVMQKAGFPASDRWTPSRCTARPSGMPPARGLSRPRRRAPRSPAPSSSGLPRCSGRGRASPSSPTSAPATWRPEGEGAPLAPYVDAILFGSRTEGRIVQNIGGIGNATVVPAAATPSEGHPRLRYRPRQHGHRRRGGRWAPAAQSATIRRGPYAARGALTPQVGARADE